MRGVEVIDIGDTLVISRTEHLKSDLCITADKITSLIADPSWSVLL